MLDMIESFVADLRLAGRTYRTVEGHELELKRLAKWLDEKGIEWREVTRRQLQEYARLRADKGFSARSNMFCTLRVFFRWAVEVGEIAISPAAGFKTPTKPKPLPRSLTRDHVRVLVAYLDQHAGDSRGAARDQALLLTALYAGLRACELAALRWSSIDFAGGVINIRISKMNHGRTVPIHPALAIMLIAWRKLQGLDDQAPVFSLNNIPIRANRVGKIAKRYAQELRIPMTAHSLRHTFATWTLRRSGNLYAVSKALGHSQVQQTEIYLSAAVDDIREALGQLPEIENW